MLLLFLIIAHAAGFITSLLALMSIRTAQGTLAWILALNTLPYVAVPAYLILGRRRFEGYMTARREEDTRLEEAILGDREEFRDFQVTLPDDRGDVRAVVSLASLPVLSGNEVELLVDGPRIYESLFAGIESAEKYLLVQFYIVRDDGIGRELRDRLVEAARRGVRVLFLYDEIGSFRLSSSYLESLREGGVRVSHFHSTRGSGNRFQLNFRNHRKVLVVDGTEGWVGGINVGDEYLGKDPDLGAMRETHMRIRGPAALGLQLSFLEDWHWATGDTPEFPWTPRPVPSGADVPVLVVASGPADPMETGSLLVQQAIHASVRRIWISTPYFVPDGGVMAALKLAVARGVDVRILIPDRPDHVIVGLASYPFLEQLIGAGVQFLRLESAFLHAKAMVLDEAIAAVGTLNLDNRSFRLNFEITGLVFDQEFASAVEAMFERDFTTSRRMTMEDVTERPLLRRMASRAAALLAPIL